MAKRYTSTVQLRCNKQHTCSSCACVYSYIMERKVVGTGASAAQAETNVRKQMEKTLREENDLHPCPNCGQFQQDMIGLRLAKKRRMLAWLAVVMPILIPILRGTYAVQANTLTWVAFFYCIAFFGWHFMLTLRDPNQNREANRTLAANRIVEGKLQVQPMGASPNPDTAALAPPSRSMLNRGMLAFFGVAVLLAVAPELLRGASGWPLNDDCYPPVVGPSDTTRVYMNDSISSIKGYWRGNASVALDAEGAKPQQLSAKTNQNEWGSTISAKSDEQNNTSHPWVEFTIPAADDLAGKAATAHIELSVEFPAMSGSSTFNSREQHMTRTVTIHLASAGAGDRYNSTWWMLTTLALVGDFVGSIVLVKVARRYARTANPTQVAPLAKA